MNSAKQPSSKTSKNNVGVQSVKGMIRLSLPRELSRAAYGKEQQFISPGLEATPLNLKLMQAKATQMSVDLATGNFDVTWKKYQLGIVAANKLVGIEGGKKVEIGLLELWEKFKEYKRPSLAETTFIKNWQRKFHTGIVAAIKNTDGSAIEIRNYLVANFASVTVKAILSNLSFAYSWGMQHELVIKNPFLGMAKEIEVKKQRKENLEDWNEEEDIRAFSAEEKDAIIEYFELSSTRKHYANVVRFLFWTGCRPGEAAALKWKHVKADCSKIIFSESFDCESKITKSTKTETSRIFPCSNQLRNFLVSIKPENCNENDLIFTFGGKKRINTKSLSTLWKGSELSRTKGAINELIEQGKVRQYLKLYATRHTFITTQVNAGIDAHVIAAWCGNSADVIWKHYYQHKQDVIPVDV